MINCREAATDPKQSFGDNQENTPMTLSRCTLILILLAASNSLAQDEACDSEVPIDSAEKAWCVATDFLAYQSCLSTYGYKRSIEETEDRWELSVRDLDPRSNGSCSSTHIAVCKDTGRILYSPQSESCGVGKDTN